MNHSLSELEEMLSEHDITAALNFLCNQFPGKVTFSSALGQEDQVLTDIIFRNNLNISVFTLDTGRLFPETYQLIETTEKTYGKKIKLFFPDATEVQAYTHIDGINGFYNSVESRKKCCAIRKINPLKKALQGMEVWITGIRASQSENRHTLSPLEWDENNRIIKFHPLFNWTYDEILMYIDQNDVPENPLHKTGFVSIGCAPCTRAILPNENLRAGRWWWEDSKKECGLHENYFQEKSN